MLFSIGTPRNDRIAAKKSEVSFHYDTFIGMLQVKASSHLVLALSSFSPMLNAKCGSFHIVSLQLLAAVKGLDRGLTATQNEKSRIEKLAVDLERLNPTQSPLGPSLTARWQLLYTTSGAILGASRPPLLRPWGEIYQSIDAEKLVAKNQETFPFFNSVEADLEPIGKDEVSVKFKTFYIGGFIPVPAPPNARGRLKITYLDDDLRISRGDKGNLFLLQRS